MRPSHPPAESEPHYRERILLRFPGLEPWLDRQPAYRLARLAGDPLQAVMDLWDPQHRWVTSERLLTVYDLTAPVYQDWLVVIVLLLDLWFEEGSGSEHFLRCVETCGFPGAVVWSIDNSRDLPFCPDNVYDTPLDERVFSRSELTRQAFWDVLADPEGLRERAVQWLPHFDPDCLPRLLDLLQDESRSVRQWAAWHLCSLAPEAPGVESVMLDAVRHGGIRFEAPCEGLVRLAASRPAPRLDQALAEAVSTVPRDRNPARAALLRWYHAHDHAAPDDFVWHESPRAAVLAAVAHLEGRRHELPPQRFHELFPPRLRPRDLRLGLRRGLRQAPHDCSPASGEPPGWPQKLFQRCQERLGRLREALLEALLALLPEEFHELVRDGGHGQWDLDWIPTLEVFGDSYGLCEVSRSCGWWLALDDSVHLSQRPVRFEADRVVYADGWTVVAEPQADWR